MPQYIKNEFSSELAVSVLTEIQYQRYNYYSFLGRCDPWPNADATPTNQSQSVVDYKKIRNNMVYMRRITSNDVSAVVRRINWSYVFPRAFDQYDDTADLATKDFYCVTDEWNVYKCLYNNHGVISTIKPTGRSVNILETADGYIWKYLYSIPSFKVIKFVTSAYMPVQRALSDSFYNKGSVENVVVINSGDLYTNDAVTTLSVSDPAPGGDRALLSASVRKTQLINEIGTVIAEAGEIVNVTVIDGGTLYTASGGGYYPEITITASGSGITGKYGNATAVLKPVVYNGSIVRVTIEDPGVNYPSTTTTSITVTGDGSGAEFTPVIYDHKLVDVVTENVGSGYNVMVLTVNSTGSGAGAAALPILGLSDFASEQATVEQSASAQAGSIYAVVIDSPGTSYTNNTVIESEGDGTGFAAHPIIGQLYDSEGIPTGAIGIIDVVIDNYGTDYTYINLIARETDSDYAGGVIRAILPPPSGHGRDPIMELYCNSLIINSFLQKDVILNKFGQDYRQLGIIKNPLTRASSVTFRDSVVNMCFEVILSSITDPTLSGLNDSIIGTGSEDVLEMDGETSSFRVISIIGNNVILQQIDNKYIEPLGSLKCIRTESFYTCISIVTAPTVDKFSGRILYVSDEQPFSFTNNQGLNIKTILSF